MSSILGIDLGTRRIGVAIAEQDGLSARPLVTIARVRDGLAAVAELVDRHGATEVVVGLPLEASGREGPMAVAARAWAEEAGRVLGVPVTLRDERLSSSVAETRLGRMPRGRSGGAPSPTQRERYRARVDREAAAVILQDELDARRSGG